MSNPASTAHPESSTLKPVLTSRRLRLGSLAGNLVFLALIVLCGLLYASVGSRARDSLLVDLLINTIIVLGFQIFIGNTGVLSFGHLGIAGLSSYVMALLSISLARKTALIPKAPFGVAKHSIGILPAMLIALTVGIVVSALLGLVVARTSGLSATMITLALLFVVQQVAENWDVLTHGSGNLDGVAQLHGKAWPIFGAAAAITIAVLFRYSNTGRMAVATREDELAAGAMGIDVFRPRFFAFLVSGGVVAFGGMLRVRSLGSLGPSQFSFEFTILILAMLVVGGMRTVTGAISGVAFITVGKEIARFLGDGPQFAGIRWPKIDGLPDLFLASSLLIILLLRSGGLLGEFDWGRMFARFFGSKPRWQKHDEPTESISHANGNNNNNNVGALTTTGLGVSFGGFKAVDSVSMRVQPQTIHGLIGPNGAGKTTVVNLLTGIVKPTQGTISLGAASVNGTSYKRARQGVSRTFQNLRVFGSLSVRENIAVADLVAQKYRSNQPGPGVERLLALSGLAEMADRQASTLDYGNQRRLEIARAAALRPHFLLLDEPTSGMSETESLEMVGHVRRIAEAIGAGVLVIDHDLGFITNICERITVLDQGRVLSEGSAAEVQRDPLVIEAYLGASHTPTVPATFHAPVVANVPATSSLPATPKTQPQVNTHADTSAHTNGEQ
jgi:branched-chain amino acid transport system permease protein